jgi:DNA-binding NarL/FixJ family response regulator
MNMEDRETSTGLPLGTGSVRPRVRILLVDDSPDFRRQAARFLAVEPGFEIVAFAASGAEALEKVEQFKPDVILMDLSMPGMNGFEATRRIKARAGAPRVVIMTLNGGAPYRAFSEAALADGFLSKAEFVEDARTLIRDLFPGSAAASSEDRG